MLVQDSFCFCICYEPQLVQCAHGLDRLMLTAEGTWVRHVFISLSGKHYICSI